MIRKIMSQAEIDAKRKRNTIILSVIMLGILVVSTLGYAFFSGERETPQQNGEGFSTEINGKTFYFSNTPENVSDISVATSKSLSDYYQKPLYIDSADSEISYEIYATLGAYASRVQAACYTGDSKNCTGDLPEKNCSENLIIQRAFDNESASENARVYENESCVFIDGDIRATDAFLFRAFGLS